MPPSPTSVHFTEGEIPDNKTLCAFGVMPYIIWRKNDIIDYLLPLNRVLNQPEAEAFQISESCSRQTMFATNALLLQGKTRLQGREINIQESI